MAIKRRSLLPRTISRGALVALLVTFICTPGDCLKIQHPLHIPGIASEDLGQDIAGLLKLASSKIGIDLPSLEELNAIKHRIEAGLEMPAMSDWEAAGNAAEFNSLSLSRFLGIPINMNVIFIGFRGEGRYGINITEEVICSAYI